MNPAFRIWHTAILTCFLFFLAIAVMTNGGGAVFLIFTVMVCGSVLSLFGFRCLFSLIRLLQLSKGAVWLFTMFGIPLIVAANALCLLAIVDFSWALAKSLWKNFDVLFITTRIPLAGALIGAAIHHKLVTSLSRPVPDMETSEPDI